VVEEEGEEKVVGTLVHVSFLAEDSLAKEGRRAVE